MKLKETFDSIGLVADSKARRRLNVSGERANLQAGDIERGISLEALESCGVPVFRYQTQVTLHGILPGFDPLAKVGGYRSIFSNANGTVGVRYAAIDAEKKQALSDALSLTKSNWKASRNSAGLELHFFSMEKEPVIEAMRSFPRDLICGSLYAGAGVFGGYYAVATIGAIPAENLSPLILSLTGADDARLVELRAEKVAKDAADRAQWAIDAEAGRLYREKQRAEGIAQARALAATLGEPLRALPKLGSFRRIFIDSITGKPGVRQFTLAKRGPRICFTKDGGSTWKALADTLRAKWEAEALAGFVFPSLAVGGKAVSA
jgi:hypothetical protein